MTLGPPSSNTRPRRKDPLIRFCRRRRRLHRSRPSRRCIAKRAPAPVGRADERSQLSVFFDARRPRASRRLASVVCAIPRLQAICELRDSLFCLLPSKRNGFHLSRGGLEITDRGVRLATRIRQQARSLNLLASSTLRHLRLHRPSSPAIPSLADARFANHKSMEALALPRSSRSR